MDWKVYIDDPKTELLKFIQGSLDWGFGFGGGYGFGWGNGEGCGYGGDDGKGRSSTRWG